jgi:hypothetical protein
MLLAASRHGCVHASCGAFHGQGFDCHCLDHRDATAAGCLAAPGSRHCDPPCVGCPRFQNSAGRRKITVVATIALAVLTVVVYGKGLIGVREFVWLRVAAWSENRSQRRNGDTQHRGGACSALVDSRDGSASDHHGGAGISHYADLWLSFSKMVWPPGVDGDVWHTGRNR